MGLCYEHIEKEYSQKSAALLIGHLETSHGTGESELKNRLEDKGRHKVVKEFSWMVHLVATSNYAGQDLEYLICYQVVVRILLQTINTVLKNFFSESLILTWI
jgi:hypothetical protein